MNDKEPDILDHAANITAFLTEKEVAARRAAAAPETHPDFDGRHCVEEECGAYIPDERLAAGRIRCTECQTVIEQRRSIFRR